MKLSEELKQRGFIAQHTGESLAQVLDGVKRTVYHGIDPSADSAHAGNMVIWMLLRHLNNAGHKVIFLVGGGTGMIGDPKPDSERVLQDEKVVAQNVAKIKEQAQRLIGGTSGITFVNNADWLLKQSLITFLRDIGKHFTVNELIKKEAIAARVASEQGISYTEFAYPLLQAFDYLTLNQQHGCDLQVGGSDQWGNIVAGVDLVRRKEKKEVHVLTVPLVVDKATGKKFGKSEGNAVWLDPEKTSPYAFYQFWLNTSDESAVDYLKLFTFVSLEEIANIEKEFNQNKGARLAQKRLAFEVTKFVHGESKANSVMRASELVFSDIDISALSNEDRNTLIVNVPSYSEYENKKLYEVVTGSVLASSNRESREFIQSGAVTLDGRKIEDPDMIINIDKPAILKRGKKNLVILSKPQSGILGGWFGR